MGIDCVGEDSSVDIEICGLDEYTWVSGVDAGCANAVECIRCISCWEKFACFGPPI